jgi:thiamine biosynthesis lipoprotein
MGTFLDITLWHTEPDQAHRLIRESVQEVHRLEEILSDYIPDSALSQFNATSAKGKFPVPAELDELLQISQRLSIRTAGYFDVTVGPLMDLWKRCSVESRMPDQSRLAQALSIVGYRKLLLSGDRMAELTRSGMKIDLGGIGKGYAVDRIADRLRAAGVTAALINFGGSSIAAIGSPPGKTGWEIGVQGPAGDIRGVIYLRNLALSTSGSMGRYFTIGNKKYGHLINPKNGMPVAEPRMASVITPSATTAEALTKPLVLLGERGISLIKSFSKTEAVVIPESGPVSFTNGFASLSSWHEVHVP